MPSQYTIGGCQVHFPHQAYGVQLSFMKKVIAALEGGHNALLEAPTGSGKTLSLLCSALAWQVREKQRIEEGLAAEKVAEKAAQEAGAAQGAGAEDAITDPDACCGGGEDGKCGGSGSKLGPGCTADSPEWKQRAPHSGGRGGSTAPPGLSDPPAATTPGDGGFMPAGEGGEGEQEEAPRRRKPPKIFYATRTHSQIAQVVKELKRSEYRPRMAVLGSRKHYCINMHATRHTSIDEACEELLKESQCQYFKNVHSFVNSGYQYRLHDIEDLKGFGKSHKACPYYTARKWAEEAEVIFAPYSYLIDPVIRRAMTVDVEGSMVIFDEAHNIEDVCREAASTEVDLQTMLEVLIAFKKAFELNGKPEVYGPLTICADAVVAWMQDKERVAVEHMRHQQGGPGRGGGRGGRGGGRGARQDPYERLFPATQIMGELAACGLGADKVDPLWEAYQAAREEEEAMNANEGAAGGKAAGGAGGTRGGGQAEDKENKAGSVGPTAPPSDTSVRVGAMALGVMSRLIQVVRMLHQVSDDGARDYRLVVQRYYENEPSLAMGRFKSKGSNNDTDAFLPGFSFKMCLWSLNPAVAFKTVAEAAHSVVLTSGTLAPLEGFASELGTPFAITLEAPHVVDMRRQVWAGVVGVGPGGTPLVATYKNQVESAFQDAVGRVVLEGAATIPDGLLVFMPSYSLLDKLLARWKTTGALKRLGELKHVVQEPRGGGQDALKKTMVEYYKAIQGGGGAVFFAVCRGKVSEGLDFADGNARGVIIVGIPFPHARDLKVNEKKAFNDRGQRQLGLVSGDTWYSQQAFRALNQALGRCIRHRLDWGAILMVDDRFRQPRNQKMLSRWVRGALQVHPSFEGALASMQGFFRVITANPPNKPPAGAKKSTDSEEAAMAAAAVAAAGAGAAPLPQQGQQPQGAKMLAGRGVEGALCGSGLWGGTTQQGQPGRRVSGAAGAMGAFELWQGKPLGQARMGPQQPPPPQQQGGAAAAAAAAALGHWGPQHGLAVPAVKQEQMQGGFLLPQTQAHQKWPEGLAPAGAAQQQHPAMPAIKREQQQWGAGLQQPAMPAVKQEQQQWVAEPQQWQQQQQQQHAVPAIKQELEQWQPQQPMPAVKQEPQQWHQQPQQWLHQPHQPHQPQQPMPAVKQEQQQHAFGPPQHGPGSHARPGSGPGLPPLAAAASPGDALRYAPLAAWVRADAADCRAFLRSIGVCAGKLPAGYASQAAVAVDGVKDAFDAAREYLAQGRDLQQLASDWHCGLPRGLQAVMAAAGQAPPEGKPFDEAARQFGQHYLQAGWGQGALVEAVAQTYMPALEALRGSPFGTPPQLAAGAELPNLDGNGQAAPAGQRPLSPEWQQRCQQRQGWQQPGSNSGGSKAPPALGLAAATAGPAPCLGSPARPAGARVGLGHAQAATPPMEWAAPRPQPCQQQPQQNQQPHQQHEPWGVQQAGGAALAGQQQQQQQQHWQQGPRHNIHARQPWGQKGPPVGGPCGPGLQQQQAGMLGGHGDSHPQQQGQQRGQPGQQPPRPQPHYQLPLGQGWGHQAAPPVQHQQYVYQGPPGPGSGHVPVQQQAQQVVPRPGQQLGQAAKRGAATAPGGNGCRSAGGEQPAAKKRYVRSKNAEAAARSRAGGAGGGSAAAALDAAQRAAIANELGGDAVVAGQGSEGSSDEFRDLPPPALS